eukprot:366225-Chlamydomonas_euryale.AAC.2
MLHSQGLYSLPAGVTKTLQVIGFVFDEPPRPYVAPAALPPAATRDDDDGGSDSGSGSSGSGASSDAGNKTRAAVAAVGTGAHEHQRPARTSGPGSGGAAEEDPDEGSLPSDVAGQPPCGGAGASGEGVQAGEAQPQAAAQPQQPRRVMGPAMPPAAVLAAAAAAGTADAAAAAEAADAGRDSGSDSGNDLVVGPPPPELVAEVDAEPADAREAEVLRVMRSLRDAAAAASGGGGGGGAAAHPLLAGAGARDGSGAPVDAYAVLGVERDTPAGDVKKRCVRGGGGGGFRFCLEEPNRLGLPRSVEAAACSCAGVLACISSPACCAPCARMLA